MKTIHALLVLASGLPVRTATAQAAPPYRDATRPIDTRVQDLLARMTPAEKFWQLYMSPGNLDDPSHDYSHGSFGLQVDAPRDSGAAADARRINAIQHYFTDQTRLGIPVIPFDEAVHGLVRPGATSFPAAIALAASWDTALMGRVAGAIADETRRRGIRQVLSPVVNLATDVRWGRVEETYGEDPFLASAMAAPFADAFERRGVIATPKHFVANVGAGGRDSYPVGVDRGTLEDFLFPPFRAAIERGHAQSVMTAYNSVNGMPATQNRWLLTDVLRHAWGFEGFVISDAAATGGAVVLHHTEPDTPTAARDAWNAGLDVVFQSSWEQHRPYWHAVEQGMVPPSVLDSAVARVLRAKFAIGLFDHPFVNPDSAAAGRDEHRQLAREAAREGLVLLRNEHALLPLRPALGRIAVIGADAVEARTGGYSQSGGERVSLLDGIRAAVSPGTSVRFARGPGRTSDSLVAVPSSALAHAGGAGLRAAYFTGIDLAGKPAVVRTDSTVDFGWTLDAPAPELPYGWYAVRWTGTLTTPPGHGAVTLLGVEGDDGYRLWLDGRLLIDNWKKISYRTALAGVHLEPGSRHDLRLEFFEGRGRARIRLVWNAGVANRWRESVDSAVAIARGADVAIIAAGIEEGEFRDRAILSLPGHQEELIRQVAATGTPVVVVLIGGSAIVMERWLADAGAVVDAWYPGEEGGHAIADVLFGAADPGGRLPVTFPVSEGQLPLAYDHLPTGRGDDYVDETGEPRFPFGFGLSYTTFAYSALQVVPDTIGPDGSVQVACRVSNTGTRPGDEVVQLYVHDELASVARPVMQLAGFTRIRLAPGETKVVSFRLDPSQLAPPGAPAPEPGRFRVMIGASSRDIRLSGHLEVR